MLLQRYQPPATMSSRMVKTEPGFPIVFPTLDLITMIGQHGRLALEEVLARPSGDLVEPPAWGGSLVLDLCLRGMASIDETDRQIWGRPGEIPDFRGEQEVHPPNDTE